MREGETVGIDVLVLGRLVHQSPHSPMRRHHPVKLLFHEFGVLLRSTTRPPRKWGV